MNIDRIVRVAFGTIICSIIALSFTKIYAQELPSSVGYINDFANVLTTDQEKTLENIVLKFREKTTVEITVVTIKSLDDNSIEEYANKLAIKWGVGNKKADNGLMILNAIDDRKWRIEVGYGLEEFLPDAICKNIGDENLSPNLKDGKYYEAYKITVEKLIEKIGGFTEDDKNRLREEAKSNLSVFWIVIIIFAVIIFFGFLIWMLRGSDGSGGSSYYSGSSSSSSDSDSGSSFGGGSFGGGGASGSY